MRFLRVVCNATFRSGSIGSGDIRNDRAVWSFESGGSVYLRAGVPQWALHRSLSKVNSSQGHAYFISL